MKTSKLFPGAVCLFALIAILTHTFFPAHFVRLCEEDGAIENVTSLAFFIAGYMFLRRLRSSEFMAVFTSGLGALCIFAAGEEISWGQRVFGIQTPESMRTVNIQEEINLHNLTWFQGNYRLVMLVLLIACCLMLPLSARYLVAVKRQLSRYRFPVFPVGGVLPLILAIAFMAVPRFLGVENFRDLDEVGELLVATAFLRYGIKPDQAGEMLTSSQSEAT